MENKFTFTFIIGYRHKPDRIYNLRKTLDWVNSFSGAQIILVEQDKNSKISNLNLPGEKIFTKSEMPYNRSWAFNVGLKYAKTNIIVFGDSDLIMEQNSFIRAIEELRNYDMVSPYNSVLDLTEYESYLPLEQMVKINRPGRGENDNQKINISGGISIFRLESILKIGGWDERFWSWGGEDDFQTIKVKNFLSWKELNSKCYHLYHKREEPDQKHYQTNVNLIRAISTMNREQIGTVIRNSSSKIGMLNKCS